MKKSCKCTLVDETAKKTIDSMHRLDTLVGPRIRQPVDRNVDPIDLELASQNTSTAPVVASAGSGTTNIQIQSLLNPEDDGTICDAIIHTNRTRSSRDLAIKFANEEILQLLALGGSWNGGQSRAGSIVTSFRANRTFDGLFHVSSRDVGYNSYVAKIRS